MLVVFMLSGCMKMNMDMSIHKDKSMDLSVTVAVANSLLQQSSDSTIMSEEDLKEAKDQGFKVKEYSDGSMTGYTLTKNYSNIDDVSTEKETNLNLEESMEGTQEDMFTVKKGLFKNKYTVKMKNDTANEVQSQAGLDTDNVNLDTDYIGSNEDYSDNGNNFGDMDLSMLMANMDLKYTVTLPYKALSSNATTTENDGKKLIWNLMDSSKENLEFEFELYNMTNVYIAAGIVLAIIIIVIILIIKKRKPKAKVSTPVPVTEPETPVFNNMGQMPAMAVNNEEPKQTVNEVQTTENVQTPTTENVNQNIQMPTNENVNPNIETPNIEDINPVFSTDAELASTFGGQEASDGLLSNDNQTVNNEPVETLDVEEKNQETPKEVTTDIFSSLPNDENK